MKHALTSMFCTPNHWLAALLLAVIGSSPAAAQPKNLIIMIGDGMGPAHLTAYRYFQPRRDDGEVAPTIFDHLLTGLSGTYPDDDTLVTDSAAGATALATGHKTCNQHVSLSCDGQPLPTLFQKAKAAQMRTGLVVSSPVTHASPAPYYAHHKSRHAHNAIADQLLDNRIGEQLPVDIIFGAGTDYLIREDRNLVAELQAAGYSYADNWDAVPRLQQAPAIALLGETALPPALHSPVDRPLARLTDKALELLKGDSAGPGFVLMIEGSQIDWCSHANDIVCTLAEMADFAEAAKVARAFVDAHPNTLLLITSDHETGGLSLARDNQYAWHPELLRNITATAPRLAEKLLAADDWPAVWQAHTQLTLNTQERSQLQSARDQGQDKLTEAIKALINLRSLTGWTTTGHTAADVPIMAHGAGSEQFRGFIDNAEIGRRLLDLLE